MHRLRDELGLPGMAVLQFGFTPGDPRNTHDLHNHREHQVVYTGTHDNDTLRGWYETLPGDRRALVDAERPRHVRRGVVGPRRARAVVPARAWP